MFNITVDGNEKSINFVRNCKKQINNYQKKEHIKV